jgi:phosphatidylglycerol:prolipoprotein diacylglycerol transferase
MHPILFEVTALGIRITSYSAMMFLACAGALWITVWRVRKENLQPNSVYELATWLFLGGVLGARALYVAGHVGEMESSWDALRSWQGGNVFYGCIMGGLTGSLLYWWRRPFPFWPMADAVAPGLAVGITFGRLGCFLNGCCYGLRCDAPWAVRFPSGSHAWMAHIEQGILAPASDYSLAVHPVQLYAAFSGLVLLVLLNLYFPHRRRDGEVMALLMILYPITRWPVEALRGDDQAILLGMTLSQVISVVLLSMGIAVWLRVSRTPSGRFADNPARTSSPTMHASDARILTSARSSPPTVS